MMNTKVFLAAMTPPARQFPQNEWRATTQAPAHHAGWRRVAELHHTPR